MRGPTIIATFAIVAVLSFVLFIVPGIPLTASLLPPLAAIVFTPLSLVAIWAAWAVGIIAGAYLPAVQYALDKAGIYLLRRKHGAPQPAPAAQIHGGGE